MPGHGGRTLIIPDVHNKAAKAEGMVRDAGPVDRVVFLGDYFDDYDETPEDTRDTAKWLSSSLGRDDRVHLIGNHDLNYMTGNPNLRCSGYTREKYEIISGYGIPWERLRPFYWLGGGDGDGGWLCTHAGLSNDFYTEVGGGAPVREVMEGAGRDLERVHDASHAPEFFRAGTSRGGAAPVGGILWCDYSEFADVPGLRQVFGHTRGSSVRRHADGGTEHICLDTVLNHYAVYEHDTGAMRVVRAAG